MLSLPSALTIFIISYACSYVHELPKLYMALFSDPTSDYFLPLQGFVIFHDTLNTNKSTFTACLWAIGFTRGSK